jgi:hypothetical protein
MDSITGRITAMTKKRKVQELMYRVWWIINPPSKPIFTNVASPLEGHLRIEAEATRQLKNPRIHSNAFGLEIFEDGEWCEWYDEQGRDVSEAFEHRLC